MKPANILVRRTTGETDLSMEINLREPGRISVDTSVPFFDHLLHAMAFHGGFILSIKASGDAEADPHHVVEDLGIVFGQALKQYAETSGPVQRFGHAVIPMDEAISEVTIDVSGRSHLTYRADYPQQRCGDFDTALIKEFLLGIVRHADITLHMDIRYGDNSHHMAESLFKALGKAVKKAYNTERSGTVRSTKGVIE